MKHLKVALIFPRLVDSVDKFDDSFWLTDQVKKLFRLGKTNYTPPLPLLILAAVTPPDIEIIVIDERLEPVNTSINVDLVGISVVTRAAYHAYALADEFRKKGVTVVLGGIHPTILTEEALVHADAVVRNQGEKAWPELLMDFRNGSLKRVYEGGLNIDVDELPVPRRDVLSNSQFYLTTKVLTATRGCPYSCTFCTIGAAIGKEYRTRTISKILNEIESIPGRFLIFLDDNLGVDVGFTKELFNALIPLKLKWAGAISLDALEDDELVRLAGRSGCSSLGVGFESLETETLRFMGKTRYNKPHLYRTLIRRLHDNGIPILGYFILGYDADTLDTYVRLADFIEDTAIEMPSINTLIPYPGTPIARFLEKEGRILTKNWDLYDTAGGYVVYKPFKVTPHELVESYLQLTERVYSMRSILNRLIHTGYFDPFAFAWAFHYNYQQKQSVAIERAAFERSGGLPSGLIPSV